MKKLVCGVLCVAMYMTCALSLAEEPVIVLVETADITNEPPVVESVAPEQTPAPAASSTPAPTSAFTPTPDIEPGSVDAPAVRWTYPISLTVLQTGYLTLVNADHMLDKSFKPDPIVKMNTVKRATSAMLYLEQTAADALKEMFDAAKLVTAYTYTAVNSKGNEVEKEMTYADGMTLYLKSGYRSYGQQATTYTNYLARNNNVDDGYVAKPGASEHQTGLSADILNADYAGRDRMTQDFKWTPEAQWMKENCGNFGFILRYTEAEEEKTGIRFEPWHFRYVGKEAASYIMLNDMTLESFTEEWTAALEAFQAAGGNVEEQMLYEYSRLNAPPESHVLDEYGADGDAEISLVL